MCSNVLGKCWTEQSRPVEVPLRFPLKGRNTTLKTKHFLKSIIFWDITQCSPLSVNRRFGGTYRLLACWFLAELIFSTLMIEAICSSKTSVDIQWTTRRFIPEFDTIHNHRRGNLKSYIIKYIPTNTKLHRNPLSCFGNKTWSNKHSFHCAFILYAVWK
jgi:hypothetical protein